MSASRTVKNGHREADSMPQARNYCSGVKKFVFYPDKNSNSSPAAVNRVRKESGSAA